jgi:hypothetical protein
MAMPMTTKAINNNKLLVCPQVAERLGDNTMVI